MADPRTKSNDSVAGRIAPEQLKPPPRHVATPAPAPRRPPAILPDTDLEEDPELADRPPVSIQPPPGRLEERPPGVETPAASRGGRPDPGPTPSPRSRESSRTPGSRPDSDGGDPVFAFRRRRAGQPVAPLPVRRPVLGSRAVAPRDSTPRPPLEAEPPGWVAAVAETVAAASAYEVRQLRERSGFHVVRRLSLPDRWQSIAVVTFEAAPEDERGGDALRALRDLEMTTWQAFLDGIARLPAPELPPAGSRGPAPHRFVELPLAPLGTLPLVEKLDQDPPGFLRPFVPWPTLADVGISEMDLLEGPVRALLDRLAEVADGVEVASDAPSWPGHVVPVDTVLQELDRWRTGHPGQGPNHLTGHHFLVHTPTAAAIGADPNAQVLLVPTQWRLLHTVWRETFVVQDASLRTGRGQEESWAG